MIFKNICVKKEFHVNGEKKTKWLNVGTLRETDDGKQFIELNLIPDVTLYVFEQKERAQQEF